MWQNVANQVMDVSAVDVSLGGENGRHKRRRLFTLADPGDSAAGLALSDPPEDKVIVCPELTRKCSDRNILVVRPRIICILNLAG